MHLREITDAASWDRWITRGSYPPFTQSWAWGVFQQEQGKSIRRIALFEDRDADPLALVQWVREKRSGLFYWFAPGGPVFFSKPTEKDVTPLLEALLYEHRSHTHAVNTLFDRCEPRFLSEKEPISLDALTLPLGAKRVKSINPSTNLVVDLKGTTTDVLERMHKKTRYNIRLAERHEVIVRGGTEADLAHFFTLLKQTAERDAFTPHTESYLRKTFCSLAANGHARLRIAERLGQPLAASIEIIYGDTVTYLHGASASEQRERMAPYALQWSAIFAAIQDGHRWYDFGGGNPLDSDAPDYRSSWEGVTRFKERWGAQRILTPGTYDLPRQSLLYHLLVRR